MDDLMHGSGPRALALFFEQLAQENTQELLEGVSLSVQTYEQADNSMMLEELGARLEEALEQQHHELDLLSVDDGKTFELRSLQGVQERLESEEQEALITLLNRITEKRVGILKFQYNGKPYEAWIVFPETPGGKLSISLSPISP